MKNLALKGGQYIFRKLRLSAEHVFRNKKYANLLSPAEGNDYLLQIIHKNEGKMVSRFGVVESNCWIDYTQINSYSNKGIFSNLLPALRGFKKQWDANHIKALSVNAGFFPANKASVSKYVEYSFECIKDIDAIGIWEFVPGESYFIKKLCPGSLKLSPLSLEPYFFEVPWSSALSGKKVLVVHPFAKSIEQQYKRRELLFSNNRVLPEFNLKTIKAVQSIAGNVTPFNTWFEALAFMQAEIDKCDFDLALIGAGSYGLPLSSYIKQKGKIAIHMGGALQILFGIKGKRWDSHEVISKLYNDYWIRPSDEEIVSDASKVEDGCYW